MKKSKKENGEGAEYNNIVNLKKVCNSIHKSI